ncbi:hypothetical protein B5S33_g4532 [[Candida] boidinii]|nr:hypothetical protein B5S30_g5249 [[Candida] boidinii]OWB85858.1 hypothetical protein B5S33_g4532 [[Candida] boidinii]
MIRTLVKLSETKILLKNESFLNNLLTKVTSTTSTTSNTPANTDNNTNKVNANGNTANENGIDLLNILAPTDTSNIQHIEQSLNDNNDKPEKAKLMANVPFNKEQVSRYLADKEYDHRGLTMKEVEKDHFDSVSMQLKYILNNFSNNNKYNSNINDFANLKLINDLLYMKNSKIYSLILKLKDENKLMIIFSHLLFINNEIKIDYLIRILMKVSLDKVLFIDQKVQSNLNNIFNLKIENNYINLMKFQIALASRYMILNSKLMANSIINKFLDKFWLELIKNGKFTSINYIRNLIRLIQNTNKENEYELNVINEKFINLIKDTKNFKIGLIFWEENFKNYEIIEIFEKMIADNGSNEFIINSNENLIISFITNPLISTKKLNLNKLRTISINSHTPSPPESSSTSPSSSSPSSTSSSSIGSFNKRLVASLEVLINELEDNYTISYSNQFDQENFENYLNVLKNSIKEYKLNHNHGNSHGNNHNHNHNHELSFIKS